MNAFFENLTGIQRDYQNDFVENRIEITERISDEEWKKIVELSEEAYQKKVDKQAKKKAKDER